jgi:hypothetical protein
MPTGYTAGILDGEITSFQQFAKICMKNFGAVMHMRDEPLSAEYKPRTPSGYHTKALTEANALLKQVKTLSDDQIVTKRKLELEERKSYLTEQLLKCADDAIKLNLILQDAIKYQPPTEEHIGIKEFMVSQLLSTLDFDCKPDYTQSSLKEVESELQTLNADSIRQQLREKAENDIRYHRVEHAKELTRCTEANQWVYSFLKSIEV